MLRSIVYLVLLGWFAVSAHAQEREWLLDAGSEEAYLIFGVPDTDDVGVSLWCPLKKGMVNLYLQRPAEELSKLKAREVALKVSAGSETVTFRGGDRSRDARHPPGSGRDAGCGPPVHRDRPAHAGFPALFSRCGGADRPVQQGLIQAVSRSAVASADRSGVSVTWSGRKCRVKASVTRRV